MKPLYQAIIAGAVIVCETILVWNGSLTGDAANNMFLLIVGYTLGIGGASVGARIHANGNGQEYGQGPPEK